MPSRGSSGGANYMAWDTTNNVWKTGDVANHTIRFVQDAVEATPTNTPTEVDATNAPGAYNITWTSAEGTTNLLWIGGKSSTTAIQIIPITIGFENLPVLPTSILAAASGVNVTQWLGTAVTAATAGVPDVNTKNLNNFAVQANSGFAQTSVVQIRGAASAGLPGYVGMDWSAIANSSATEFFAATTISGIINAVPATLSGVTSAAQLGVNVVTWHGDPVSFPTISGKPDVTATLAGVTSSAQLGVNVVTWAGDPVTFPTATGFPGVDVERIKGAVVQTSTAQVGVNVATIGSIIAASSLVQGNVNVVLIGGALAATSLATGAVNVNKFIGQSVQLDTANLLKVDLEDIAGAAVNAGAAQLGVNAVQIAGVATVTSLALANVNVVSFNGTATVTSLALGNVNVVTIGGLATATSLLQGNVNIVTIGGALAGSSLASGGVNVNQWRGGAIPTPNVTGEPLVDINHWRGTQPATLNATFVPSDVQTWLTVAPNTLISGRVDAYAGQIKAGSIATGTFNAGALATTVFPASYLTSALIDTTAANQLADALLDRANAIETGLTPRQGWRLDSAALGGNLSGAGLTAVGIWGAGVTTTRISAATDQSGNRSSITLNL